MSIEQWSNVKSASPKLNNRASDAADRAAARRRDYGGQGVGSQQQSQSSWSDWLNKQRNAWNARFEQPQERDRRLDERSTPYYNAGFFRGTNANYGDGVTSPQGVDPLYHNNTPARVQGGQGVANPMMAVRGGFGSPYQNDPQVARPTWTNSNGWEKYRLAGTTPFVPEANHTPGNSFVSGDGLRANLGANGTRYVGPDFGGNYLNPQGFMDMYLDGRFDMLPPPDDGESDGGFGSYYGRGGGWGGGWGGGGSSKSWDRDKMLSLANWNIK